MIRTNRLLITLMVYMACAVSVFAIDNRFPKDSFQITRSGGNPLEPVTSLSVMDETLVFQSEGKFYSCLLSEGEIVKTKVVRELGSLNIEGQFSLFSNNLICYANDGVLYLASLKNGSWTSMGELKIEGYGTARTMGKGSSFAYRRWQYKGDGKKKEKMYNPVFAHNGRRIYFSSSEIRGGKGGKDIWFVEKNSDGTSWSKPQIAEGVNSEGDEDYPFVVGDTLLCFSSNRKTELGRYNLYKKSLVNAKAPARIFVPLFNSKADDYNFVFVNGSAFFLSTRQIRSYIFYPKFFDADLVADEDPILTARQETPSVLEIKGRKCVFHAEFEKSKLAKAYDDEFERIFEFINAFPNAKLEILAYVDEEGDESHNYSVSLRQASAVMDRLVEMGVAPQRITYDGKGNTERVVKSPRTEEDKKKNRIVEITLK